MAASTSLADQLRRLATPQTTALVDSKKRASILFDAAEAANRDREEIYDIGLSGLHELAALNPAFLQFEHTLFDRSARELARSVESSEANRNLDHNIKRFFVHLAPHVLLQSAHKALEWLIRRFGVHEHNQDDLMLLLLPYHETRIFVCCVQIMPLRAPTNRWNWLHALQKPGVPLSKLTLFNRAATDAALLRLIGRHVLDAVSELDARAHQLQALFAFYCTVVLGAIEHGGTAAGAAGVDERLVAAVQPTLLKALQAPIVDLCAAAMMICGTLFTRCQLTVPVCDGIVQRLAACAHPALHTDAAVLMVLCAQHQQAAWTAAVRPAVLRELCAGGVQRAWIVPALRQAAVDGVHMVPFLVPVLAAALREVQQKAAGWSECKRFCELVLGELSFVGGDVEAVIRCILDAYVLRDAPDPDVIVIESDNEDDDDTDGIQLSAGNQDINSWYTELLKLLDRQYPAQFERVTKQIMQSQPDSDSETFACSAAAGAAISGAKRQSLQRVLGFLFTASCADDGTNIFANLYHHCTENRVAAMRYLVKNYAQLSRFSDDSRKLLRNSIAERLRDDSPAVVLEVLRLGAADLVQLLDAEQLVVRLRSILTRALGGDDRWQRCAAEAIGLITEELVIGEATESVRDEVFLSLWPFLWPAREADRPLADLVRGSAFVRKHAPAVKGCTSEAELAKALRKAQQSGAGWPGLERLLPIVKQTILAKPAKVGAVRRSFYALLLVAQVPDRCTAELATECVAVLAALVERVQSGLVTVKAEKAGGDGEWRPLIGHMLAKNEVPVAVVARCLEAIVGRVALEPLATYDVSRSTVEEPNHQLHFLMRTFCFTIDRLAAVTTAANFKRRDAAIYAPSLATLLQRATPRTADLLTFCANFTVAHRLPSASAAGSTTTHVLAIRVLERRLTADAASGQSTPLQLPTVVYLLAGLQAPSATVRECTMRCLDQLIATTPARNSDSEDSVRLFLRKVIAHREELLLDATQLPLVLFRVFRHKSLKRLLDEISALVTAPTPSGPPRLLHALVLNMCQHINDADWLRRIAGSSLRVLQTAVSAKLPLDALQSSIVRSTLLRVNADTVAAMRPADSEAWRFVQLALRSDQLALQAVIEDGTGSSAAAVPIVAIEAFDGDTFEHLSAARQTELLRIVFEVSSAPAAAADLQLAVGKLMRRVRIDAALHLDVLEAMVRLDGGAAAAKTPAAKTPTKKRPSAVNQAASAESLSSAAWRSGQAFMEYLSGGQLADRVRQAALLLPGLFGVLRRCLQFEDQTLVVYSKQLTLAALLACLKNADTAIAASVFEIDLVVQCIRGTQNPQTHHHALALLAHTATIQPELVLHNMMDIFTFVGTSVVRRDDAYTYQIIANIIHAIVPALIASKRGSGKAQAHAQDGERAAVVPILRVFADIVLDVPEHRRQRLYADLLQTLGAERYASAFLALLFESHVQRYPKAGTATGAVAEAAQSKRIDIACELLQHFDCGTVLTVCTQLVEMLHRQPAAVPTAEDLASVPSDDSQTFVLRNYNNYQLRHFKYMTLQFVVQLSERSGAFVMRMAQLSASDTADLKPHFKQLIVQVLQYIGQMHRLAQAHQTGASSDDKIWRILLANCYDVLDQVLALIYPEMLLQVVTGLLSGNNIPEVRRKALELLNRKLQLADFFAGCGAEATFVKLLEPLATIVESICDRTKLVKNSTAAENVALQQQALIAVKILSGHMAQTQAPAFRQLLDTLAAVLKQADAVPVNVLAQSVLCVAELCANLRAHSISLLPKFMPSIDKILLAQTQKLASAGAASGAPNIIMYVLTAVHKICAALPRFLSPYLVSLLTSLSQCWALLLRPTAATSAGTSNVQHVAADTQRKIGKLQQIWTLLAGQLQLRTLVPMIDQCYRRIVVAEAEDQSVTTAVQPIMQLLTLALQPLPKDEINAFQAELGAFFQYALQLRSTSDSAAISRARIDAQEDPVIDAFVALVLKLSETSFRPMYQRIYNWAVREAAEAMDEDSSAAAAQRSITFYRLSARVAQALKSLFVLFSGDFIPHAAGILAADAASEAAEDERSVGDRRQLVGAVLRTLHTIFVHDSQAFVNALRFDLLLQPLVDQLHSGTVLGKGAEELRTQVVECLAQLGAVCGDDGAWKRLNYQILLQTRSARAEVRMLALGAAVELARRLGEDYTPLLPETVPFLAEMLEDEDAEVERECQQRVQELERVLGEPLQKYF